MSRALPRYCSHGNALPNWTQTEASNAQEVGSYPRVPIGDLLLGEFTQPTLWRKCGKSDHFIYIFSSCVGRQRSVPLSHISGHGPLAKLGQAKADQ